MAHTIVYPKLIRSPLQVLGEIHTSVFSLFFQMANTINSTPKWELHLVFQVLVLVCFMMVVPTSSAAQYTVGGANGWTVPDSSNASGYDQWARMNRFRIGDSLVFKYNPEQDSVLEVTKQDYDSCTTTQPIEKYSGGHTIYTFTHSGPHHFISGNKEQCHEHEKLEVVVLADRSNHSSYTNHTTAASPPSPESSSSGTVPSPAPTGDTPPPPTGTVENNPTSAPSDETPNSRNSPSSASSTVAGFIGSAGAVLVSSLIF